MFAKIYKKVTFFPKILSKSLRHDMNRKSSWMKVGKNPIGLKKIVSKYSKKQNIFDERERIAKNEKKVMGILLRKEKIFS